MHIYSFNDLKFTLKHLNLLHCFDGLLNKYICLQTCCHSTNWTWRCKTL